MKRTFIFFVAICLFLGVSAQGLAPITWTAYGLTFKAPSGILVEEDTEDTFLLNNARMHVTLHSLESDGMERDGLGELLQGLANDDGVQEQSEISDLDLEQFHVVYLKGKMGEEPCYYACMMTKDAGSVFYLSIIYNRTHDKVIERILESFKMEETIED